MRRFRFSLLLLLCAVLAFPAACTALRPRNFLATFEVSLWVQAEGSNRTLDRLERIDELVRRVRAAGVTDLYVQVYRGGRAWYPTRLADDAPSRRAGRDPLAYLIGRLREGNGFRPPVRVHTWINTFALARNRNAPIIAELGREAVLRDVHGRSLLDYPRSGRPPWAKRFALGTPGIFLDPAHPGVRRRIAAIAAELLSRYPALSGIHLDFIRYPYAIPISPGSGFRPRLDFGYGKSTRARFRTETGHRAPTLKVRRTAQDAAAWDDWRRKQVSATLAAVRRATRTVNPAATLSAAVLPWAERAYLISFQDWRGWLQQGILDKVLVMNYSRDTTLAGHISRAATGARFVCDWIGCGTGGRVVIGLGAYLFVRNPEKLWRQWADARNAGADGVALFSYDQLLSNDRLWRFPYD